MLDSQRLSIRLSEIRERLNEILVLEGDAYTDEVKAEEKTLQVEHRDAEQKYRSAVITEGEDSREQRLSGTLTAEEEERLEVRQRANVSGFITAALGAGSHPVPKPNSQLRLIWNRGKFPSSYGSPNRDKPRIGPLPDHPAARG